MSQESWHNEFSPKKFLNHVNLAQLIERNEAYNNDSVNSMRSPCVLCAGLSERGIFLNDKSFLCQQCYSEVATISYPEKYETLRRQFFIKQESRKIAWGKFSERFECQSEESDLLFFGFASLIFVWISQVFLLLTVTLLVIGYTKNNANKCKVNEWTSKKQEWEKINPEPISPELKHFHDPNAHLSQKDAIVLKIFNHWPGYPPFWKYLRSIVIARDSNRCQVTGCPSRLELHVHHIRSVADGGAHTPENLVSLCDFHHALEPEKGHDKIWKNIKTRYFTFVCEHERNGRLNCAPHRVSAHLRRIRLITSNELYELARIYGFCCPSCRSKEIKFIFLTDKNIIKVECQNCKRSTEVLQQLTEETGPRLAEILFVSKNMGKWKSRWDTIAERSNTPVWGEWSEQATLSKRKAYKEKLEIERLTPSCPLCGAPMKLKRPWKMNHTWKPFWGCTQFQTKGCRGKRTFIAQEESAHTGNILTHKFRVKNQKNTMV